MVKKLRGRDKFKKYRTIIMLVSKIYCIFPRKFRLRLFYRHRMSKGTFGIFLRYCLLKSLAIHCGDNVLIQQGVYLLNPHRIIIGNNVSIHPMCYIDAKGGIIIGDDVSIAHGTTIMSSTHTFNDLCVPIKNQEIEYSNTTIEDNVWIGAKSTILAGNTIGQGSIIGANTVVTRDVKDYIIVAGTPARIIKERNKSKL